jgi:glycosyltransferase involved in cell wall biosynthesis
MAGVKARLVIAGDGEERDALEEFSRRLGVTGQVEFLGFSRDVDPLMRSFDVFVLPSLTEGISLTILEAMAAAKPVITTRVGGNPEVVIDGRTGILVPPQDPDALAAAIVKLMKDPALALEMGKNGRKRFEEIFDLGLMVTRYEDVYRTRQAERREDVAGS